MTTDEELRFRKATREDARALADRLRQADDVEIRLCSGPPRRALPRYVGTSTRSYIAHDDDRVLALFGVATDETDGRAGLVWMVASDELIRKYRRHIVRDGPRWLRELGVGYDRLWNYAYARNETHLRFLGFLGCQVTGSITIGAEHHEFLRFEWVPPANRRSVP